MRQQESRRQSRHGPIGISSLGKFEGIYGDGRQRGAKYRRVEAVARESLRKQPVHQEKDQQHGRAAGYHRGSARDSDRAAKNPARHPDYSWPAPLEIPGLSLDPKRKIEYRLGRIGIYALVEGPVLI